MPELLPVSEELSWTAGVSAAPLPLLLNTVRVGSTGPRSGQTDLCLLFVLVTHCVTVVLVLRTWRGAAARLLLHPVDTFVQIANILVTQLGAVGVVYTGSLLHQISVISKGCC